MIDARPEQEEKALWPMLVTLAGISIDVRFMLPSKALIPMVSSDGVPSKVTDVRPLQPSKTFLPMLVTPLSMTTLVMEVR